MNVNEKVSMLIQWGIISTRILSRNKNKETKLLAVKIVIFELKLKEVEFQATIQSSNLSNSVNSCLTISPAKRIRETEMWRPQLSKLTRKLSTKSEELLRKDENK